MSVESLATSLGGLIVGYAFHESSGTNLDDFSTNSLDATLSTRGTLGGTAVLTGQPRAVTASGSAGTGAVATRAVAGGSPLQTTNMTVMAFVRPSSYSPSGTRGLLGERNANFQGRWTSNRQLQVFLTLSGVGTAAATGLTGLTSGERGLVWFTYDGTFLRVGMNDAAEHQIIVPGTITNTTDALQIGAVSNNSFDGEIEYWMMFNRALEIGEIRGLLREGDTTIDRGATSGEGSLLFDLSGDENTVVAASTQDALCRHCGGRMRAAQARVTTSTSTVYHDGCRGSRVLVPPGTISAGTDQDDYARRLDRLIRDQLDLLARRANTAKTSYWNGTQWVVAGSASAAPHNAIGAGTAAAALARYLKTSKTDPLNRIAIKSVENAFLYENQNVVWWQNGDFIFSQLGTILVFLKDRMDPVQHAEWVVRFVDGLTDVLNGGTDSTGGVHGALKAGSWYINGNRQYGMLVAVWCAAALTGDSVWELAYEDELDWLVLSTTGAWTPGGIGGTPHAWVTEVTPANADGSDGKGWFREAHDTGVKGFWNFGTATGHDAGYETINVDGFDKNYSAVQQDYSAMLCGLTGDDRHWRYLNMLTNKLSDFLNRTGGTLADGTAALNISATTPGSTLGSRTQAQVMWRAHAPVIATWRGKRTTAWDAGELVSHWVNWETVMWNNGRGPDAGGGHHRLTGLHSAAMLMCLDRWPGH